VQERHRSGARGVDRRRARAIPERRCTPDAGS